MLSDHSERDDSSVNDMQHWGEERSTGSACVLIASVMKDSSAFAIGSSSMQITGHCKKKQQKKSILFFFVTYAAFSVEH